MAKQYKSGLLAAVHESAEALHRIGAVDKRTMKEFDDACLTPVKLFSADEIRTLRERERLSQPVFARYFNVTKGVISAWERGTKKPSGPAMRLLTLVQKNGIQSIA
jgi:putative transcriptional regulator